MSSHPWCRRSPRRRWWWGWERQCGWTLSVSPSLPPSLPPSLSLPIQSCCFFQCNFLHEISSLMPKKPKKTVMMRVRETVWLDLLISLTPPSPSLPPSLPPSPYLSSLAVSFNVTSFMSSHPWCRRSPRRWWWGWERQCGWTSSSVSPSPRTVRTSSSKSTVRLPPACHVSARPGIIPTTGAFIMKMYYKNL